MKIKHDEDLSREEKIEKIRKWAEEKGDLVKVLSQLLHQF